jgi:hypothetical protein
LVKIDLTLDYESNESNRRSEFGKEDSIVSRSARLRPASDPDSPESNPNARRSSDICLKDGGFGPPG